jgi:hypothetical protein
MRRGVNVSVLVISIVYTYLIKFLMFVSAALHMGGLAPA